MSETVKALSIPSKVQDADLGVELVRFWVSEQKPEIALRVGEFGETENEARMWGSVIADITRHAVAIMKARDPDKKYSEQDLLDIMMDGFDKRLVSFNSLPDNFAERQADAN